MNTVTAPNTKATESNHHNNTTVNNAVILNKEISSTAFRLYCVLAMLAGNKNMVCVRIKQLAELISRAPSTVRKDLNSLIDEGIIERVRRISPDKENLPSVFIIGGTIRNDKEVR